MTAVLSAVGLTKRFGDLTAVNDLSFEVDAGSVTGFLRPNGAGKTTTRMLLGLAEPTEGSAAVFGRPFVELDRPGTRVGAVLEATDLHPGRTGRDHLRVLAPVAHVPMSRVDEVLALVDLKSAAGRRAKGHSLGMRQRLGAGSPRTPRTFTPICAPNLTSEMTDSELSAAHDAALEEAQETLIQHWSQKYGP